MRIQRLNETNRFLLSDGGLETFLIFEKGYDLPCFSAAVLLDTDQGRADLRAYFERFIEISKSTGRGISLMPRRGARAQLGRGRLGRLSKRYSRPIRGPSPSCLNCALRTRLTPVQS